MGGVAYSKIKNSSKWNEAPYPLLVITFDMAREERYFAWNSMLWVCHHAQIKKSKFAQRWYNAGLIETFKITTTTEFIRNQRGEVEIVTPGVALPRRWRQSEERWKTTQITHQAQQRVEGLPLSTLLHTMNEMKAGRKSLVRLLENKVEEDSGIDDLGKAPFRKGGHDVNTS